MQRKEFLRLSLMAPLSAAVRPLSALGLHSTEGATLSYVRPGDPQYELLRRGFNRRIDRRPALIAPCRSTAEVAEAVREAAKLRLPVAVKSGGHCMEGFSVNNNGLVVNLSALNTISWLGPDRIRTGPGCTLAQLYGELLPRKKFLPGGSCAGVALGGLTLGGGYGLLSRKFGLTCDSLQAVTLVDGHGQVIRAEGDHELLWACRGGNNGNFGVVTEMEFSLHPAPATLQSHRFRAYRVDKARAQTLLSQWFSLTQQLPDDCFSAFVLNGRTVYILLTNAGPATRATNAFIRELRAVTDKTTATAALPLARALQAYYGRTQPLYFKNASAGLYRHYAEIEQLIPEVLDITLRTPGMIYQVNTLGGKIRDAGAAKASAFAHRQYNYFSELQTYWEQPAQEKKLVDRFQQVQDIFFRNGITAQYRNYPDLRFTQWERAYYGELYPKLQRIKSTYDPANLFRYEQSIRPAGTP